jgi:hypothetical protein
MEKDLINGLYGGRAYGKTHRQNVAEIISKHELGPELFETDAMYRSCVEAIARGEDPLKLLAEVCVARKKAVDQYIKHAEICPKPMVYLFDNGTGYKSPTLKT